MGWRKTVHRLTGLHFHRHYTLHKGEVRIEMWSGADGEGLEHIELYSFGELVDEHHGSSAENTAKVKDWVATRSP